MQVSDKGLLYLEGLVQLRRLALQGTNVTSSSMPVVSTFSELEALDIAWTAVDGTGALVALLFLHFCCQIREMRDVRSLQAAKLCEYHLSVRHSSVNQHESRSNASNKHGLSVDSQLQIITLPSASALGGTTSFLQSMS